MKYFIVLHGLFFSVSVFAGGSVTSTIDFLQSNLDANTQLAYIKFDVAPSGQPTCALDNRFVLDLTSESGRMIMSMALAAKMGGASVFAEGTGACISKFEKMYYMRLL